VGSVPGDGVGQEVDLVRVGIVAGDDQLVAARRRRPAELSARLNAFYAVR